MRRPLSLGLCSKECGARCCRGPNVVSLTGAEARQLGVGNSRIHLRRKPDGGTYMFIPNGEPCMYLTGANKCSIYDERPMSCRVYPSQPQDGCLAWPLEAKATV